MGPTLGSSSSFRVHSPQTFSRLEQSTTNSVLHADSLRPPQSDGRLCHLLPSPDCLPGVFTALSDVLPLLRHIWKILQQYDPTDDLVLFQQDIAGFFNFVTHPRMVSTVEFLITRYAALQGLDLQDDPILSVAQHPQERLQRIFRGRWRKTSRSYHPIHLRDLPDLVSHLLESSDFTVGLTVFRQCQGASMGSPLAPALCSAVALFREYCFLRSFPSSSWRYATGLALRARYVDNVFFLGPAHMLRTDSFQAIAQPFFYGRPLEMEYVADETLLGFALSTSQRTITFRQPPHLALIRSNRTAGSPEMALAGFFTRGILICRLTRPRDLILPQLADLTQQYLDKDFTMVQLLPLLHQLCHRFHLPRRELHAQFRFLSFS